MEASRTGIQFSNDVHVQGDFHIFKYRNFYNGGGVGIGDINNDGLPDLYLTKNQGKNGLFLNKGNFEFEDITDISGTGGTKSWSTGVAMVDINSDGFLDIYVCNAGNADKRNELFINNGDLSFTESAAKYNLDENGFTTHAAFFDYDGDGDLDVYILNNSFIPASSLNYANKRNLRGENWNVPEVLKGGGDKLLRNDNDQFVDVSEDAGIFGSLIGFGLGVTIGDVNNDHLPDIYVSNDFYERDYLYINQGNGTFKEEIQAYMQHLSLSSMGSDMADLNNDGLPEIFVTDMRPEQDKRLKENGGFETYNLLKLKQDRDFDNQYMQNTLQINNGDGTFSETAYFSGVAQTDWSWGALIFDMDNDGFKDIYVSNGIYRDITNNDYMDFFANNVFRRTPFDSESQIESLIDKMPSTPIPNYAYHNNHNLTFTNKTKDWGLAEPSFSNGSSYGDLDNDGDLDLVVNNVNQEVFVFRNNSEKNKNAHFLKIKLEGKGKNRFGIGSRVIVYHGDKIFDQTFIPTRGFQSSVDNTLTFGLGKIKRLDSLVVIWPDQSFQTIRGIDVDRTIRLHQEDALRKYSNPSDGKVETIILPVENNLRKHHEDNYIDYNYEGLVSQMLSQEGPAVAVGDINGDGNDDLYLGGAKNQSGTIYTQTNTGNFEPIKNPVIEKDSLYEDTDALFIDTNNNGKLDLVVVSGGNIPFKDENNLSVRIYLNTGKGKFLPSKSPVSNTDNSSVIAATDYDADGDIDLFIGSRSVPRKYGPNPKHKFLENDGNGNYSDITLKKAIDLNQAGMITDATWADMDGDKVKDLVVVGDWEAPKIFKNTLKSLVRMESSLDSLNGAWNCLKTADLNNDGKLDLVLGNRGTNSFYRVGENKPVKIFISDFDSNGTVEQICTRTIHGKDIPVHLRRELTKEISSLNKQILKSSEYATKSMDELFSRTVLDSALVKHISTFKSVIAYNQGNKKFQIAELPPRAQFSSIHAIETVDIDKDGILDILMAGNDFDLKPQFGRLDANYGITLLGDKEGNYSVIEPKLSGFFLEGEVRNLHSFKNKKKQQFVIAGINDALPKIFKIKNSDLEQKRDPKPRLSP
ncbi:MAG TPA: VCBS repeat-containing protein [Pricia sp.]|nr:VCBS repeat-containing protein [Pricia sp.]